jgi:D-alanyl-D-alanine carboxypeptidase
MLALVSRGPDTVWASAGTADTAGAPITPLTRFRVGSITKPIVGALVLLAVDDGLFGLDDEVETLLPGVLRDEPQVTVRQLLDHSSGVFNEGDEGDLIADVELIADPSIRDDARELLHKYQAGEPVAITDRIWIAMAETHERYNAPGQAYHYSNVNYQVLGMILERVTGQLVGDLLRTQIVEPLGLTRTSFAPTDTSTPEMRGYDTIRQPGTMLDLTDDLAWFGNGGNGGVFSTAAELMAIMQAIVSGQLLSEELTAEMKAVHHASYGLGLATYDLTCGTFYGHAGTVLGTRSIALVSDESGDGIVIALNLTSELDARLLALAETLVCSPH